MGETQDEDTQGPDKTPELSPEEKKSEEEALQATSDEEIRSGIIERTGLDAEIDKEVIDKLVEDKKAERKKLSTAIGQKRVWRGKAQKAPTEQKPGETPQDPQVAETEEEKIDKKIDDKVNKRLEERDLESLEVSDELKKEIKSYAELNKVTIKEALDSEYIKYRRNAEEEKERAEDAGLGNTHKTGQVEKKLSEVDPSKDFDLSTPEGREEYAEWKKKFKDQQAQG